MKTSKLMGVAALLCMALAFTNNVMAQTTPAHALRFGLGLEAAEPTGSATIGTQFILGGTARAQYGISNSFAITLTSGAYHFFTKIIPGTNTRYSSYGNIPVKIGIKEFFAPNIYFGAETGVGFEVSNAGFGPKRLILAPALGYANTHWDIGVRYENFSNGDGGYGMVALRLGYGF
jgi:hypothetical protein